MEQLLKRYISLAIRRAWTITLAFVLLAAVAGYWLFAYSPLKLDTDFTTLLPDDLPCVIESRRVSKLIGSTDYLIVAVDSPNVEDNLAFIDDMARKLATLPELEWVSVKQDRSYFRDRRLLYMDKEDLKHIVKRAQARLDYEKKIRNPFYISLDDEQPPDIDFADIMEKYRLLYEKRGAHGIIKPKDSEPATPHKGTTKSDAKDHSEPAVDLTDRMSTNGGRIMSVIARPSKPALDMEFGRALVEKTQKLINENNPHRNPEMKVQVAGAYRNRYREYENVVGDIYSSLGLAVSLILLIIIVFFRRVRSAALIFIPLIIGIIFTVALTALTLGRLNMTTALIFAVLLGLGIDFGVHMSVRYLDERARGKSLYDSLALAIIKTGRAIVTAGLTTAGGLAVLILAQFKGFAEFGIIATMGICTCLLVYILLLPAMAALFERASVPKPWRKRAGDSRQEIGPPCSTHPWKLGLGFVVVFGLAALGLALIPQVSFEYNFKNLRGKKVSASIRYGKSLGQHNSPIVAVMPTPDDAKTLTRHLEEIIDKDEQDTNLLRRAYSLFSLIPDEQEEKLALLTQLRGHVDKALELGKLKKSTQSRLEEIRRWTETGAITIDELPSWVLQNFTEKDGTIGRMVYIYPRVDEWKIDQMEKFYEVYGTIDVPGKGAIRPAASGFIMVEVVRAVQQDGLRMTLAAIVVVFLLLLIDLRSPKKALVVFAPIIIGATWMASIMAFFDIRIGLYNMLVLPTLLGIGIDSSVHLYHAYKEHGPGSLPYVLRTTGVAIAIAAATTAVGFAGMLVVSHAGLKTIGILAIIGIATILLSTLIVLPLSLSFMESRASKKEKRTR